jgi:nucleoside-diphosphate-sugar epimerase
MTESVVITGSTGFVGSHLTAFLIDQGYKVHLLLRDHSSKLNNRWNKDQVETFVYNGSVICLIEYFKDICPKYVIHLASFFVAEHNFNQIDSLVNSNLSFGLHLLEAMKEANVKLLINTGTSWQHFNNGNYNPVCLYAATKQAFESLIEYYLQAEGLKVITLKLFDTFGENDKRPKLINMLCKLAVEKAEMKLSAGEQLLNIVHVADVCDAFFRALQIIDKLNSQEHRIYWVKHSESYSLKEVVDIFENVHNCKLNIVWGGRPYRKREVMTLWTSGHNIPGWNAKISLLEGFRKIDLKNWDLGFD